MAKMQLSLEGHWVQNKYLQLFVFRASHQTQTGLCHTAMRIFIVIFVIIC